MNKHKTLRGTPEGVVLRTTAIGVALGLMGSVQAFDYEIYTHSQPSTATDWSTTFTLPAYTGSQTIAQILITYTSTQQTRFKLDNDDNGSGYTVALNLAGTVTLTIPGAGSPTFVNSMSSTQSQTVAANTGDGPDPEAGSYVGPDGFNILASANQSGIYSVPAGDFALFTSTAITFGEAGAATSAFAGAPVNSSQSIATASLTSVTLQYVLVPEAGTAWAALPVVALAAGAFWRRRKAGV